MTTQTYQSMDIIVHSYQDNLPNRTKAFAVLGQTYTNDTLIDQKLMTASECSSEVFNDLSRFGIELSIILNQILRHYPSYVGTQPVIIYTSERAIPKLLMRLNTLLDFLTSKDGIAIFEDPTISMEEIIKYINYDLCIFDPRIKTADVMNKFLEKFIPLVRAHVIKHIRFEVHQYKAMTIHKKDPNWRRQWYVANEIRSHVLRYADLQLGLTLEQTKLDVNNRRSKYKK